MEYLDLSLRLFCALVAGALIGATRERIYKPAGLRTHSLICVGAAFITVLSTTVFVTAEHGDPGRVAAQIVSGIGFLGAGTILKKGFPLRLDNGCNTVGDRCRRMGFGSGEYLLSAVVTVFALMIVLFLKRIELLAGGRNLPRVLIVANNTQEMSKKVSEWFMDNGLTVESLEIDEDEESLSLLVEVSKDDAIKVKNLIVGLSRVKGIRSAELR